MKCGQSSEATTCCGNSQQWCHARLLENVYFREETRPCIGSRKEICDVIVKLALSL